MKNKGFSFVELLVAVAILGIISLPIVSSFALAAKTDAKAYHLSAMNDAADDVMLLLEEMQVEMDDDADPENEAEYLGKLKAAFLAEFVKYASEPLDILGLPSEFSGDKLEFSYNRYHFELTLTNLGKPYCRVDIKVTHVVSGDDLVIERKGLLSYD